MRTLSAMLVAVALLLVGAAPALAVTGGFGVAEALRGKPLPIALTQGAAAKKHAICEAANRRKNLPTSNVVNELEKRFTPVACEQPPRSQAITGDALKHATAAALAVLG